MIKRFRNFGLYVLHRNLKKFKLFKNSTVKIYGGFLKGYNWSLYTSDETYLSGNFDTDTLSEFEKYIRINNVVYDLGANEGYYSIVASKLVGANGKVFSFEPLPQNITLLKTHIEVNSLKNIYVVPKAVSNNTGTINFSLTDDMAGNTYLEASPKYSSASKTIQVETVKLDDFIADKNNTPPNLIKIDVEGAELDVLTGATTIIKTYKPIIILATHDFHVPGIKDKCINFLTELGYKYYKLNNHDSNDFADFLFIYKT